VVGAKLTWKQTCQINLWHDKNMECTLVADEGSITLKDEEAQMLRAPGAGEISVQK